MRRYSIGWKAIFRVEAARAAVNLMDCMDKVMLTDEQLYNTLRDFAVPAIKSLDPRSCFLLLKSLANRAEVTPSLVDKALTAVASALDFSTRHVYVGLRICAEHDGRP